MNLFELFVKIGVDDQASGALGNITSKLGNGLKTAAKVGTAAVSAAAAGIAALTGAAIKNYAEYEQLVGGVETLFKDSADRVQQYAAEAYKTAGLSANEYMSQVTSFSASLLQSLEGDTQAAADYADRAVTDMADNANKMGTSMEMIQNAYQGFAKQNFTMLDNLKLGYGGTKQEMERLIEDANAVKVANGEMADLSIDSFADIVDAIHIMQEEMGIAGTTALEASETISGSIASMKSAWQNLVTGIADENADFGGLVSQFVESVATVSENILPRVQVALNGVAELVAQLLPVVMEQISAVIANSLPKIAESAVRIVETLVRGISQNQAAIMQAASMIMTLLVSSFVSLLPQIIQMGLELIVTLANAIVESLPELIPAITEVIGSIAEILSNPSNLTMLVNAAIAIITAIITGIGQNVPMMVESAAQMINTLVDGIMQMLPQIIEMGLQLIVALATGIAQSLPELIPTIIDVILQIITILTDPANLSMLIDASVQIVAAIITGIIGALPQLIAKGPEIIKAIITGILSAIYQLLEAAVEIVVTLVTGLVENFPQIVAAGQEAMSSLIEGARSWFTNLIDLGRNVVQQIKEGISQAWGNLVSWFNNLWDGLFGDKTVDVDVETSGSHAGGLPYVPFDGYIAELHKGERVLTAAEAMEYNKGRTGQTGGNIVINQYIETVPQTPVEFAAATAAYFEQARWAF